MPSRRFIITLSVLLVLATHLCAQLKVEMRIRRRLYIVYEPIMVTVNIANLSGHDLTLSDSEGQKWFSFQVTTGEGRIVPPVDLNYQLQPLTIAAGETVKRSLNLGSLYAVQEFGLYRIKASVYASEVQKYFSSPTNDFEITEGKIIWEQTVGVPAGEPGAGSYRTISLLTHRTEKENMLYVRVQDKDGGLVYTTNQLGRVLFANDPEIELDKTNKLHVLQLIGAKSYVYSKVGLNGEWLGQLSYNAVKSRPVLKKMPDGEVKVSGGELDVPVAPTAPATPKLSDRPPNLPRS